ncbi:MAG TPA: PKD domain-containing protein [Thermoplasmata archaeon]|nr:PKD domain-containing protein [Thermoplasmata archaeon]
MIALSGRTLAVLALVAFLAGGAYPHLATGTPATAPAPLGHIASLPGASGSHPASASATASSGSPVRSGYPYHPTPPPFAQWNNSASCQNRLKNYLNYYGAILPTDVVHTEQTPCYIGHDEPGLNFISNSSYSGSRVQFVVDLPPAGTNTASAFSTMWVGLWLAGVPCSYRGQSYLEVQINPPYNVLGLTPNPNWTVQAPVWDLVPAGSCDPQCQNDTAFSTVGGLAFCEDDAAISGVGTYTSTGWGNFAPGDQLIVQIVGQVNGTSGTSVYINDTTNPTSSLAWTYSPSVTTDGRPLTPFYNASAWTNGGWGYGLNAEATWENCPEPTGADYPSPCNSYDQPAVDSVGVPSFVSASFWNATTLSYSNPFPWTATTSSAGACSGYAAPCQDFTTYGGTGFYPYWSLHAFGGRSWWVYGGTAPHEVTNWGQSAGQFNPLGFVPVYIDPTTVFGVTNGSVGNTFSVSAGAADPNGVQAVEVSAYFCFGSTTPSVLTKDAVLTISPYDTVYDGNWSTSFSTGVYTGTLHYWVRAESTSGVWSTAVSGSASITGVTGCGFSPPAPPLFSIANVTAVGGGYDLNWSEASPGVVDYTVWFNATVNGTPFSVDAGNATELFASYGLPAVNFTLWVNATSAAGLTRASPAFVAPVPLAPLAATLTGPTSTAFWVGHASVKFVANASGGEGPYTYTIIFGDGTTQSVVSSATSINVTHDYGSYFGNARASVAVNDSLGDTTVSGRQLIQIWATPLGVPQSIAASSGEVMVSWGPPASPAGSVLYYTVYYSTNPTWAYAITETWPVNNSGLGLYLWNTTASSLTLLDPDGTTFWAQVVAWDAYGEGQLPAGSPYLVAVPEPFLVGPVVTSPGGPAPYTATFTTFVTNGTNDALVQAVYTTDNTTMNAQVTPVGGGAYINASYLYATPGFHLVVLHATDTFFNIGIQLATVYVSPGASPAVTLAAPTTAGWIGWQGSAVSLSAVASGGTGPYTYSWAFGDGATSSGANASHVYSSGGNYTVSVQVTDTVTLGTATATHSLLIYALPTVSITAAPGPNGSLSFTFGTVTTGGSGPAKITWSFGDGSTTQGSRVTHDYAGPGTYIVNATATDPTGRAVSTQITLTASGSSNSGGAGGTFLGVGASSLGVLLIAVGVLAFLFLLGMVYFWTRARRPAVVMAPEPSRPPEDRSP